MRVRALSFEGWNMSIAQLFGSGPKMTVRCGSCRSKFKARIAMENNPEARCPCGAVNVLPLEVE